jgi:hypothetical protein
MKDKKVAIMQPYFFPYIGYFQLINSADVYVNLDHVNFMKRSYMTRNLLKNNTEIKVQVSKSSQNTPCNKTYVNFEHNYAKNFLKKIEFLYSKSKNYKEILQEIVLPGLEERVTTISSFNLAIIKKVCRYLNIETTILDSSEPFDSGLKFEDGLIDITKKIDGTTYVNALGGQSLYSKENFAKRGIELKFIRMESVELEDPYLSILHQIFQYPKDHIIKQISGYSLI